MERFYKFSSYLKEKYNNRVQKITIDAGFTCPVRDGNLSMSGCFYCNSSGSGNDMSGLPVNEQIENQMKYYDKKYNNPLYILYFQAFTNSYDNTENLIELYNYVYKYNNIISLAIGTRPDCISNSLLEHLSKINRDKEVWIEVGLESANITTLNKIGRMHGIASFVDAITRINHYNLKSCVHIIFGIPFDTSGDMLESIKLCSVLKVDAIKIHSFYIEKGTVFEDIYRKRQLRLLSQNKYIEIVCNALRYLNKSTIIQRLTGDPDRKMLIAPQWTLDKHRTLNMIDNYMEEHDFIQGDLSSFNYVEKH